VLGTEIRKCNLVQINRGVAVVGPLREAGLKGREANVVSGGEKKIDFLHSTDFKLLRHVRRNSIITDFFLSSQFLSGRPMLLLASGVIKLTTPLHVNRKY
jgi:hypothetical protein